MATAPSVQNIYSCTPRQARAAIVDCIQAGLVPFVKSSPGLGKSTIMRSINDQFNLHMIDHRASTSAPEDLSGLPRFINNQATFTPFDIFPLASTPIPDGKDGWMIFLDEFNSASKEVQAACYKLILDKMVGQHKLHQRVVITAAGNHATDRAIVNPLGTAMQSRVITINMIANLREWMEDVAIPQNYDERITAYINYKGVDVLMNFRPDHQDDTFCCPRTWEFMNKLVTGKVFNLTKNPDGTYDYEMEQKSQLYGGTITSGVAVDFIQFTKVFHSLIKIEDVVRAPTTADLPDSKQACFAAITHLGAKVAEDTFGPVSQYINRMEAIYQVLFFRIIKQRLTGIRHHPAFIKAMTDLNKYLYED